jgi:hypothetical protein
VVCHTQEKISFVITISQLVKIQIKNFGGKMQRGGGQERKWV